MILMTAFLTSVASSEGHTPTKSSSLHSNITILTIGSSSPSGLDSVNIVRMNGSTSPPHAVLLYMPLHCCLFESD